MTFFFSLRIVAALCLTGGLLAGLHAPSAQAVVQEITAEFVPDPANPMVNRFVNTTPQTGVCPDWIPTDCVRRGIFSLKVPGLQFNSSRPILANHADPRQGATFSVPSSWRNVDVIHSRTGERETVQVRIAGIGGGWNMARPPGVSAWSQGGYWFDQWRKAAAPCTGLVVGAAGVNFSPFFWLVPEGAGACGRIPSVDIPWFRFNSVSYVYELRTPNPLAMSSGEYKGSLTYTTGPGGDFDMGDVLLPNDSAITLNFTLNVMHSLKVDIPPGGDKVQLVPAGGWQSWLQAGRKPVRLFRDQTFHISASSRFKMQLECEFQQMSDCAIRNPDSQRTAAVQVSVSLPNGLTDSSGQPVQRRPLRVGGEDDMKFQPGFYVDRAPGTLHFEMSPSEVERIVQSGEGERYVGNITVIWDSEV
jgi:hypothetical protein